MLQVTCPEYLEEVRKFADSQGIRHKLEEQLDHLSGPHTGTNKCVLGKDFAPYSFSFLLMRKKPYPNPTDEYEPLYNGGIIFYAGEESGVGGPQFSVTLSGRKDARWEIHT